eukprot:18359_1
MSTKTNSKSKSKTKFNQFSNVIVNNIIKECLKNSKNKKIKIDDNCKFVIGRIASQFAIHIAQFSANNCEEDGRIKITGNDVIEVLKDLELENCIQND